jgi:hypothetical protein
MKRYDEERQLSLVMPSNAVMDDPLLLSSHKYINQRRSEEPDLVKEILFFPNCGYVCLNSDLQEQLEICIEYIEKNTINNLKQFEVLLIERTDIEDGSIEQNYVINNRHTNEYLSYYDVDGIDKTELIGYAKVLELLTEYVQNRKLSNR